MRNNIRSTNLRFNLEKDLQRKAWEYLQTMDKQEFKSYSHVIALALVDYFDRYYRTKGAPKQGILSGTGRIWTGSRCRLGFSRRITGSKEVNT